MPELTLEVNEKFKEANTEFKVGGGRILITPPLDDDYWAFRVAVSEKQAIVGFPKFFTIGVGFQHEEDWNTNLPYQCEADEIFNHISHNKGDDSIPDELCIEAIKLVQEVAAQYQA
jgi:hypothetical protein